jgi:hypothetical protein
VEGLEQRREVALADADARVLDLHAQPHLRAASK